jgi:alkaline phosphatase D
MAGVTVAVNLTMDAEVRLAASLSSDMSSPTYGSAVNTVNHRAKPSITGLTAGSLYYLAVEIDGVLQTAAGQVGQARMLDASANTLKVCLSGDADTDSDHAVFDAIRGENAKFFIHMGDQHYEEPVEATISSHIAPYDRIMALPKQGQLRREMSNLYCWDDHDFGPNDSFSTSGTRAGACRAYRKVVPSPTLVESGDTDAPYFAYEVSVGGLGVIFIVTDQRSMASNRTATDNSSKTILGTAQKTWFKGLFSDAANDDKLFIWVCSRTWGGVATASADHWGGFTTERTELADHFKAEAPGRVLVVSADMHSLAIDSGANHDFSTGGGDPIPTFQVAPLDRTGAETHGGATYDQGAGRYTNNNQYGVIDISKTGASQLTVDWTGKRHTGVTLVTYQKVVNL